MSIEMKHGLFQYSEGFNLCLTGSAFMILYCLSLLATFFSPFLWRTVCMFSLYFLVHLNSGHCKKVGEGLS